MIKSACARHLCMFIWVGFRVGCRREELETSDAKITLDLIRGFSYGTRLRISSLRSED
jgi:hypothetical protein